MKLILRRADFKKVGDRYPRVWNKLLKQLGVIRKERYGVRIVILDVLKAEIPNATGELFDYTKTDQDNQYGKAGDI